MKNLLIRFEFILRKIYNAHYWYAYDHDLRYITQRSGVRKKLDAKGFCIK